MNFKSFFDDLHKKSFTNQAREVKNILLNISQ